MMMFSLWTKRKALYKRTLISINGMIKTIVLKPHGKNVNKLVRI